MTTEELTGNYLLLNQAIWHFAPPELVAEYDRRAALPKPKPPRRKKGASDGTAQLAHTAELIRHQNFVNEPWEVAKQHLFALLFHKRLEASGCAACSEHREDALRKRLVHGCRQCFNCSTPKTWKRWGKCVACGGENLPLEMDHVLGRKYQPPILEPLCRNCHRVKTFLTEDLPNSGDVSEFIERAEGAVSAYAELAPETFLEIQSIAMLTCALIIYEISIYFINFITERLPCEN